jgi:hypothetical protein
VVVAAVAALAGQASVLATYFVTRAALDARPAPGQSLAAVSDDMPVLLALGLTVVMYTLIGLALATMLRSAAADIGNDRSVYGALLSQWSAAALTVGGRIRVCRSPG